MAPATTEKECIYQTRVVRFLGHLTPIILQNENGPSPLLAICNVLLLRGSIKLNQDIYEVSQDILLSLVRSCLSTISDKDVIDVLSRLKVTTWTDINLQFSSITDFEFTQERAIFDLLNIPLYHGCLVDPQDNDTASAIGHMSYKSLTRKLLAFVAENLDRILENDADEADYFNGESTKLIADFLSNNASQLTFHGFSCLQKELKESEICVFFRKSQFSTLFKYEGELYLLATNQDRGCIIKADLVWEKLKVNGDTVLMTEDFKELCIDSLRIEKFQALSKKLLQYKEQQGEEGEFSTESDDDDEPSFLSLFTRWNLR